MIVSYSSSHKLLQRKIHLTDINKILMLPVTVINFRNFFMNGDIERWIYLIVQYISFIIIDIYYSICSFYVIKFINGNH